MSDPASQFQTWVAKAEEDRLCIANNLAASSVPWSVICFHAQQAAEKYLKALLISRGTRVERTHDLEFLLEECRKHDATLSVLLADCQALSSYAVDSRYPDVLGGDIEKIARDAVAMCDRICLEIKKRLETGQVENGD
jgi:HEPN domain-containing protein